MHKGKVVFYDKRIGGKFGFFEIEEGEQIFFCFGDGRELEIVDHKVTFSEGEIKNEPKRGDRVVFEISHDCDGAKALRWAYIGEYEHLIEDIATPMYRMKRVTTVAGNQSGEPEIIWAGCDIVQLMKKHPRSNHDGATDGCNSSTKVWFERSIDGGDWEHAEDPRLICPSK